MADLHLRRVKWHIRHTKKEKEGGRGERARLDTTVRLQLGQGGIKDRCPLTAWMFQERGEAHPQSS
jgi:hypothetical protein